MEKDEIITQARTWIGTPFKHQGRIKEVGVDCLGLLIGVAKELNLRDAKGRKLADFDALDYGHLPDERRLWVGLSKCLRRVDARLWIQEVRHAFSSELDSEGGMSRIRRNQMLIALFQIDGTARHLGMIADDGDYPTLIHAYAPARKVVEHRLDEEWIGKLVAVFEV